MLATTATEKISVYCTIALYIGVALAMPSILYQAVRFLTPGLTRTERRSVYGLLSGTLLRFAGGVAFASAVSDPADARLLLRVGPLERQREGEAAGAVPLRHAEHHPPRDPAARAASMRQWG